MMRFLLLSSGLVLLSCGKNFYTGLPRQAANQHSCIAAFKPTFATAVYQTQVEVAGRYLSGLLVIKAMDENTTRIVFTNEAGYTFFAFEFGTDNSFKILSIARQLDKKAVIKTLQKNFSLLLFRYIHQNLEYVLKDDTLIYHTFKNEKDYYYYLTDSSCSKLVGIERGNSKKRIVKGGLFNLVNGVPDSMFISHTNFEFNIYLKQLPHVTE